MRRLLAVLAAGMVVSACATTEPVKPTAHTPPSRPAQTDTTETARPERRPEPRGSSLARLDGWDQEDHLAGLMAFRAGCGASKDASVQAVCARARALRSPGPDQAREFLEENFEAVPVGEGGVLTAYFAPEYEARDRPDAEFSAPVRPRPGRPVQLGPETVAPPPPDLDDLIDVALAAGEAETRRREPPAPVRRVDLSSADRATIERSAPDGALAWMRAEDLFFLQIQGSGTLVFPDGRRMKAAYAGDNGKPFVAIARPMSERGIFPINKASGDNIRAWLSANRGPRADAVMQLNPRYIFFALSPDDGIEPAGAAGVPLPAGRAIAVDPSLHPYGDLYWIDAEAPAIAGAHLVYRRLAMALDTGSAIRGQVRADLYMGRGAAAGAEAGRVRHTLKMVRLRPVETVRSARHDADAETGGG